MTPTEQLNAKLATMEANLLAGARSIPTELRSCRDLIEAGAIPEHGVLLGLLKKLKGARAFPVIVKMGRSFKTVLSGLEQTIIAQAEIEEERLDDAEDRLEPYLADTGRLGSEANGLMGRIYKQYFVSALAAHDQSDASRHLLQSLAYYETVYDRDPVWHGPNIVGLCWRAGQAGLPTGAFDLETMAKRLQADINALPQPSAWSEAAMAQAHLGLGNEDPAMAHYERYADLVTAGNIPMAPFMIGGDRRQLREIWLRDDDDPLAGQLMRRTCALLHPEISAEEARGYYAKAAKLGTRGEEVLEAILSGGQGLSAMTFERLAGAQTAICKIKDRSNPKRGGSGFLLKGEAIGLAHAGPVLVTNEHVVAETAAGTAMSAGNAEVQIEKLGAQARIDKILWCGSKDPRLTDGIAYDITIAALKTVPDNAGTLDFCDCSDVFNPPVEGKEPLGFVLPVGHPNGGDLIYSVGDNDVLDHDLSEEGDHLTHVCYTANTESGSSGSPIFTGAGEVVAVHKGYTRARPIKPPRPGIPPHVETNFGIGIGNLLRRVKAGP